MSGSVRRIRRSVCAAALLVVATALLVAVPASADPVPGGYTYTDYWFTSHDGIQIHAGVFLPADRTEDEKHPVLMNIGPYTAPNGGAAGGNLEGIIDRNPELWGHPAFQAGRWAYVQVDARGFGGSEGCFEYYLPSEAEDVERSPSSGRRRRTGRPARSACGGSRTTPPSRCWRSPPSRRGSPPPSSRRPACRPTPRCG